MKKSLITVSLLTACLSIMAADSFTIKGSIPGLKAGTKVHLVGREHNVRGDIVEATATDGAFILTGSVQSPTLSEIRIESTEPNGIYKSIELMVENVPMTVSAAYIDSIAPGFYVGTRGKYQERNVTVTGGNAQKEFEEYKKAMFDSEVAAKKAHYDLYWADDRKERSPELEKQFAKAFELAQVNEDATRNTFIKAHPAYSISGYCMLNKLSTPFVFTSAELDEMEASVRDMPDASRRAQVNGAIANSRKFTRESMFTDFAVLDTLGAERKLSEFANKGKYVMVDFWASWCGPCRAAIPHVRELHGKYGDSLEILAVSLDSAEKPWRKAMNEEKMDWTQLWADKERVSAVQEAYQIHGIPFMLLIDPQGRIVHAGHSPAAVTAALEKIL